MLVRENLIYSVNKNGEKVYMGKPSTREAALEHQLGKFDLNEYQSFNFDVQDTRVEYTNQTEGGLPSLIVHTAWGEKVAAVRLKGEWHVFLEIAVDSILA